MATLRQHLYGEHPLRALVTVIAVGGTTALLLIPFGLLEIGVSGLIGTAVFAIALGVVPGVAGGICGRYRLGFPAAVGSGIAPGVAFYLVVAVGAALEVGSFGGGDSPLGPFALLLTTPSFLLATAGFTLTILVTILRE
ncbi:hypothetical protein C488_14175 [Natrinema pellirubrum DSM 15624]|uniref:Uncharacterized protein n=1 Tax=Natrinema pellirubrum (strain DSM 15624 / CIP 106293 / JCM 10476 / NCIMB 786 / 157) TaxID=797303 RepID=L9YHL4_NATP1|nr:hypothetical protein [Natrinema pellirubrum]ELY73191.1 hypothetical protein C488_14175 [Natrinema pellirubrum DSM 15624]